MIEEEAARVQHGVSESPQPLEAFAARQVQRLREQYGERSLERLLSELVGMGEIREQRDQVMLGGWSRRDLSLDERDGQRLPEETLEADVGGNAQIIPIVLHGPNLLPPLFPTFPELRGESSPATPNRSVLGVCSGWPRSSQASQTRSVYPQARYPGLRG